MTRETVAGERPRCSARNFRLTAGAEVLPRGREDVIILDRGMGGLVRVVSHKETSRASSNRQNAWNSSLKTDELRQPDA